MGEKKQVEWSTTIPAGDKPTVQGDAYHEFKLGSGGRRPFVRVMLFDTSARAYREGNIKATDRVGKPFDISDRVTEANSPVHFEPIPPNGAYIDVCYSRGSPEQ